MRPFREALAATAALLLAVSVLSGCAGPASARIGWRQVSAGDNRTCGIKTDRTLWCWGETDAKSGTDHRTPTRVGTDTNWAQVDVAAGHACGLHRDRSLWCWGNNQFGQLGTGSTRRADAPVRIGRQRWTTVGVSGSPWGESRTCAIRVDGTLWCWGGADPVAHSWLLGLGPKKSTHVPLRVGRSGSWTSLSVGPTHTCAIRQSHSLWCWGSNMGGELGDGTYDSRSTPVRVGHGNRWLTVSVGLSTTCATRRDRTLWCWGSETGPLGQPEVAAAVRRPRQVGDAANWRQVVPSEFHTCATTRSGHLYCWIVRDPENARFLQSIPGTVPARIVPSAGWTQIAVGDLHTCALRADGSLWCWGFNTNGQLGSGGTAHQFAQRPQRVRT